MYRFKKISSKALKFLTNRLYLILLIPLVFIVYPLLGPGVVLFGDFPIIETSLYGHKFLSTWIDYGSHHGFETLSRYPIITLGIILSSINVSPDVISKFLVVLGFFTASFSFYYSWMLYFKDKLSNHFTRYRIAAIVGSIFYAYNVWSFHRIAHWYLWLGYAFLPLFVVYLIYALKNPNKWKYVLVAVLTWTLASSTPHMVIFYGLFYLSFSIYFIIRNITNKQALIKLALPILSIISMYLVINLYWIYPDAMYILNGGGGTFAPSVLLTKEETEILSRDSSFLNVFRLIEDWWKPRIIDVSPPQTSLLYPFWLLASFVFPIVAFSSLLLIKRSRAVLLFSIIGIIGILLTLGTNGPFNFYSIFLFEAPLFSTLQFLFRDPDKWGFMIALAYSFLLSITSFELLKRVRKLRYYGILAGCFLILIFASFILYSYPTYTSTAQKVLDPVSLPPDYEWLNKNLGESATEKVFFIFQNHDPTVWNKGREFCCLDQRSSAKPNMMIYGPAIRNYHDYLINSILSNKSNNINNFLSPLGTSDIIYSNDDLNTEDAKLKQLSQLQEFKNIKDLGFFKLFRAGEKDTSSELQIPKQSIVLVGGLDLFTSLNSLPSFSTLNSSLVFLDQNLNKELKYQLVNSADYLALAKNNHDLTLSFLDEKYIIRPYDATNRDNPNEVWSKSVLGDPENADFQLYLNNLGIENWEFDYGKGIVMTKAMGAKLSVPVEIENQNADSKDNNFYLFMRYLKNQKGGLIKISLDGKVIKEVDSFDRITNKFAWEMIHSMNLTKGRHTLTLENVAGFNAVNIFAFIPPNEMNRLRTETAQLLEDKIGIVYILEAESNFYNNKGVDNGSFHYLSDNSTTVAEGDSTNTFTKTFAGQFKVPPNTDLVTLQFLSKQKPNVGSYAIKELDITPAYEKYNVFTSNFERELMTHNPLPIETLGEVTWINEDKDILTISRNTNGSIYGNSSLSVDLQPASTVNETVDSRWSVISTDFIPIKDHVHYNYSLYVSAEDVNQLHSKVYHYDSDKKEISWDFIFEGKDGTFEDIFSKPILSPIETKYIKLQTWIKQSLKPSSYVIDNIKIKNATSEQVGWVNEDKDTLSVSKETNEPISGNSSLRVDIQAASTVNETVDSPWSVISTDFIPISNDAYYYASLQISAKDVKQLHSRILYFDLNMKELTNKIDFIFEGKDGTFEDTFTSSIFPPKEARYVKYQILTSSTNTKAGSYISDNMKLEEITFPSISLKNKLNDNLNEDIDPYHMTFEKEDSLEKQLMNNNSKHYVIQAHPLPVKENYLYNYTINAEAENMSSFSAIALFTNSGDVVENSTGYGNNASNGGVLSLNASSELRTGLDIIKSSNYAIALRAKACETCTYLRVTIKGADYEMDTNNIIQTNNVSLQDKSSGLRWLYSNSTYLTKGSYELEIYSDSQADLDSVMIYATDNLNISQNNKNDGENSESVFITKESPASIAHYKKINPTKYEVKIHNATRQYMLAFSESYDPLWKVYAEKDDNFNTTNSIPLFSIINGFIINKTGDYTLTIEYQPQKWFVQGGIVSVITVITISMILFIGHRQSVIHWKNFNNWIWPFLRANIKH